MTVLGYSYDADHHCESCILRYATSVPYSEYDFTAGGTRSHNPYTDADITLTHAPGIISLGKAIELEIIRDSEGNAIHPIFSTDEWHNYSGEDENDDTPQTLTCSDCGVVLDTYEPLP